MNRNKDGFTLLEVMVAMAIMVMTFVTLTNSQIYSQMTALRARKSLIASFLAEEKMSELSLDLESLPIEEIPASESGEFPEPYKDYKWEIHAKPFEYNLSAITAGIIEEKEIEANQLASALKSMSELLQQAVKEVTVTIKWKTGLKDQAYSLTTHAIDQKLKIPNMVSSFGTSTGGPEE